jgi:hypothetical protein
VATIKNESNFVATFPSYIEHIWDGLLCLVGHFYVSLLACKNYFGILLYSGRRTLWHEKNNGSTTK